MNLPNGSASGTDRILNCPASVAFPQVNRQETIWAKGGHSRHGFVRAVLTGTPIETAAARLTTPEDRETCRNLDWGKLVGDLVPNEGTACEASYAYDVRARTARYLGQNIGRDYHAAALQFGGPLTEWEIPGSLDIEGLRASDRVPVVVDLKFGYQDVTSADENGQGLFFAACKRAAGAESVEFRIAKVRPSGGVLIDSAEHDAWSIDSFADSLETAVERSREARRVYLAGGTPEVQEGPWCGYCPAFDSCPAKNRLALRMLETLDPLGLEGAIDAMTDEAAGRAYDLAKGRVAPLLDRILAALEERAHARPLPLAGDKVLRETPHTKEQFSQGQALALVRQLGGTDAQIAALFRTIEVKPVRICNAKGSKPKKRKAS